MNSNLGSRFTQQSHQHPDLDLKGAFDPTTEEGIVKGLNDLLLWAPFTHVGHSVITQALELIEHLKDCNKKVGDDPYLKLRKFGEEMLSLLSPHHANPGYCKQIFFYNYPNNEVYFGFPANLETESPPVMLKSVLGTTAAIELSLDEAIAATKHNTDIIQSRVFGMPLQPAPVPNPQADWEFTMRIDTEPFESAFKLDFMRNLKDQVIKDPDSTPTSFKEFNEQFMKNPKEQAFAELGWAYETFKDKFNLSRILNSGQRTQMDLRVFCVKSELHWEWVKSQ